MDVDEINLESHFVENPFIRVRERAAKKQLDAKNMLNVANLEEEDNELHDIIMMKEAGKFYIKDLEQMEQDKADEKTKKRKRADLVGYGEGEDIDSDLEDDEINNLKRKMKDARSKKPTNQAGGYEQNKFKQNNALPMKKRDLKGDKGHIIKASGDQYKSDKGKGDVLKAGTHEPYAYIKLNPEMLNPKKKHLAV